MSTLMDHEIDPCVRKLSGILLAALLLVSTGVELQANTLTNNTLNFSLNVPDGYISLPASGDSVYNFATSDPAQGLPDAAVSIQRLHGTIGREHLSLTATGIPDAHFLPGTWKGFDIDIVAGHITVQGTVLATRCAQIPLENEAVQIVVVVPTAKEPTSDAILEQFVAALDGPSNWSNRSNPTEPTPYERGRLLGEGIARLTITIVLLVIASTWLVRYFRRRKPRPPAS